MEPMETATIVETTTPNAPAMTSNVQVVVEELLIEEISIDGMCGVY